MTIPQQHTTTPRAATYEDLLYELKKPMAELQTLHQQAIEALAPSVQDMVRSGNQDVQRIERTLDQLLNHACMPKGLALFKNLCRHYWTLDPQATASYVNAYREMWDGDDLNDTDKMKP